MIFDLAFTQVWHLFRPRRLFPNDYMSMVEWQVPVTLFMSSVVSLEANTYIKAYGLHSLTKPSKCIMWEDNEHDKYAVNDHFVEISENRMHIVKRYIWHYLTIY